MSAHGSKTYFAVEDSAGSTLRNISPYITSSEFNQTSDVHDNTTYGATAHTRQLGLKDGGITISGFWDKTASVGAATVLDSLVGLASTVGFEYGPEGNASGNVKHSGECVLASVAYSAPVADLVTFTATFNFSGPVTKGTFSA